MTTARCPACGASVLDGAPWCTLCYADLRAPAARPAAPQVAPAQPAGPRHAASGPRHAASAPPNAATSIAPAAAAPAAGSTVELLDPLSEPFLDAPVVKAGDAPRGAATWPCLACGASVALEHDACTQCGTPFLAGADPVAAVDVPLVGPIRPLAVSKGARAWVMIGGGLAVCIVLVIVLSLVGLLL